jgi:hypothetical protein
MAGFRRVQGKTKFMFLPVTVSTAFSANALVTFTSGELVPAGAATAADNIIGVIRHAIASTDDDYATARLVEVEVPVEKNVVWEFDTASLVAGDIGADVDLTDSVTVNRAATAVGVVRVLKVISSAKGQGLIRINDSY